MRMKTLQEIQDIPLPPSHLRTHDSRGHLLRGIYAPHDDPIRPHDMDIFDMEMRHRHGDLSTAASNEFRGGNQNRTNKRLRRMSQGPNTDHGGPYIYQPAQQFRSVVARSNMLAYGNTPFADRLLKQRGLYRDHHPVPKKGHDWKHSFMGSSDTSSVHLAIRKTKDYGYIFHDEIAERAGTFTFECPYSYTMKDGKRFYVEDGMLEPDPSFGIIYPDGTPRIFFNEHDCHTERKWSDKINVQSWQHKIEKHYAFVGQKGYEDQLDLEPKTRVMSRFLFSDTGRMKAVMQMLYLMTEGKGSKFILFQSWPAFGPAFVVPKPRYDLFDGLYYRVGYEPFNISLSDGGVRQ